MRHLTPIFCFMFLSQIVISQCSIACISSFTAELNSSCEYTANTTDLLAIGCSGGVYLVEVFDQNNDLIPGSPTIDGSYLGTTISYTITETNSGNNCFGNIILEDNIAPTINCIANFSIVLDATGVATLDPSMINAGSADNCTASINFSLSQSSFDCSNLGSNFVTLTATDDAGNSNSCFSDINVLDNDGVCPPPPTLFVTGPLDADENYCAGEDIESDAQALPAVTINFNAGESILLLDGFEVMLGSDFTASIGPCID